MKKHLCMPVTAALTLGMMSLGGAHVFASDTGAPADEHSLGETVVTATRTPLSVRQAPANVAVITAQEIEQNHYRSASEALEHVNGVVVDRASGEEYVRLNGDDRVVVMVDGVRLNNDQGVVNGRAGVDLRMIPSVKDIKRIEVVKGGGSALYGSDAVGGVVNIITKRVTKEQTELDLRTGSWGSHSYELSHMGTAEKLSWQLTAGLDRSSYMRYKGTDGKTHRMPSSDYANNSLSLRLDHRIDPRQSLTLSVLHRTIDANSYYNFLPSSHHDAIYNMVSASYNFKEGTGTPGYLRCYGNFKSVDFSGKYDTRVQGGEYQNSWKLGKDHTLAAGLEWRTSHSTNVANGGYSNKKITNKAVYVQDTIHLGDKWVLVPGVRLDHHSRFGSHSSPKIAVNYNADEKTRVYASWGRVYKAPTADDLFYNNIGWSMYGNPDLRPESGHTESLGISHNFDARTSLSVDFFQSKLSDAIHWYYDSLTLTSHVANIAHEKKRGMEILFKKRVNANWSYDLGYSYTGIEARGSNDAASRYLNNNNQPNGGRIGVHYNNSRWHVNVLGTMASGLSKQYYGRSRYAAFELNAGYDFADGGTIYARLRNATNQAYSSYSGTRYPQPARYAEIGVRYQF